MTVRNLEAVHKIIISAVIIHTQHADIIPCDISDPFNNSDYL